MFFKNSIISLSVVAVALNLVACNHHTGQSSSPALAAITDEPVSVKNSGKSAGVVTIPQQPEALAQMISQVGPTNQTYYFDFNSTQLSDEDLQSMKGQANYLTSHPKVKIRLEGNTDNRGSREYNVGLGWRRDQAVAQVLEQQGVQPSQIEMISYGKEHPAVAENNERAWRLNRRVNLVYEGK